MRIGISAVDVESKTETWEEASKRAGVSIAQHTFKFTTHEEGAPEIAKGKNEPSGRTTLGEANYTRTSRVFTGEVETNGAATEYHFEYTTTPSNPASWVPFTTGASGTVSAPEDFAEPVAELTGLEPYTTYYVRLKASNADGAVEQLPELGPYRVDSFTTPTANAVVLMERSRNVTATSARLVGGVQPNGLETSWHFESAPSAGGPWTAIPGLAGTISQAQAEALPEEGIDFVESTYTGLHPSTPYYVRLYASNVLGEGEICYQGGIIEEQRYICEPIIASEKQGLGTFETSGPPSPTTLAVHALHGESVRLLGAVNPNNVPTSDEQTITIGGAPTGGTFTLTFDGQRTVPIAFDAPAQGGPGSVENALKALASAPEVGVNGLAGGPYTVRFYGGDAGVSEPQITADGSGLMPSGSVTVATIQNGGEGNGTEYYFEYVTQAQFERSGFGEAQRTAEEPVAPADTRQFVGQDVPGLQAGEAYRYRLVASSSAVGIPVQYGAVESLTAPAPAQVSSVGACPNAQVRTGPSTNLPDCRAYEQVTPVDKEGSQEPFNYGPTVTSGAVIGEDGEHAIFEDPVVSWGPGPEGGQSPYFFARAPGAWAMTAGSPEPQTGVQRIVPELYSPDLTQVALEADVYTSLGSGESKEVGYEVGPAGGPYALVASVPRSEAENSSSSVSLDGWVASSTDFSKLVLQVADPNLVSPRTTTKSGGNDLYEYSEGRVKQVNVGSGTCGANVVTGHESLGERSSSHAVSAGGSRVFFEAAPGSDCEAPSHLYVRENGVETVDLGEYRFAGANAQGSEVLLESESPNPEFSIEDLESGRVEKIFPNGEISSNEHVRVAVSADFAAIYFELNNGDLYRYGVAGKSLDYMFRNTAVQSGSKNFGDPSPDGRFYYFKGSVGGIPGNDQVFLYDSSENMVECVSCASSFDPEPKLPAFFPGAFGALGAYKEQDGFPSESYLAGDGDFAFFDTPAALVRGDVDGEVAPTPQAGAEFQSEETSPSSDVYEWRRDGVDGCGQLQGCLALLTNGRGGFLNLLIGTADEGRDVLIYTRSQLVAQDNDNSGDIYDVRSDGGFPPPPARPVECEGDACSTPPSAPNDATPASSTLTGSGNIAPAAPPRKAAVKSKKKTKAKKKVKKRGRKAGKRAKRSAKAKRRKS